MTKEQKLNITKGYTIIDLRRKEPYIPKTWEKEKEARAELRELLKYTENKEWRKRLVVRAYEGRGSRLRNQPTEWVRPKEINEGSV